jgi:hypothetical protein
MSDTQTPAATPTIDEQLDAIAALSANWDGYGSPPIAADAVALARFAVKLLQELGMQSILVFPTRVGGVQIEFDDGVNDYEAEIEPGGGLVFFKQVRATGETYEVRV